MDILLRATGLVTATCCQVIDCGMQTWDYSGEHRARSVRELVLGFELWSDDAKRMPRLLTQRYNRSFHPSAKLHQHLRAWLGRSLTPEERADFPYPSLLGRSVSFTLVERSQWYTDIDAMRPAPFDRPSVRRGLCVLLDDFKVEDWERLSPLMRDRIMRSPTYLAKFQTPAEFPADYVRPATTSEILGGDEIPW